MIVLKIQCINILIYIKHISENSKKTKAFLHHIFVIKSYNFISDNLRLLQFF